MDKYTGLVCLILKLTIDLRKLLGESTKDQLNEMEISLRLRSIIDDADIAIEKLMR